MNFLKSNKRRGANIRYGGEEARVGGAGGFGGAQAPPSFSDLFSKNFQNLQNFHNFIFFYLIGAPHKKFASAHPEFCNMS